MKIQTGVLLGLVGLCSGCMDVVRGSSRAELTAKQSRLVLMGTADDAARRFSELFSKRGIHLTDRQTLKSGDTVYVFKGQRSELTSIGAGHGYVSGATNTVGSAYFVRLTPQPEGTTEVELFGKPTVDGHLVCDGQEPAWVPRCADEVYAGMQWNGLDLTTGREEAETLRGMLAELDLGTASGPGSRVAVSEAPTKPACTASELPEWKTSSALEKKRLLEKCRMEVPDESAPPSRGSRPAEVL